MKLSSNRLVEWLQAMDALRKAGFPAFEGDSWHPPQEAAEGGL